MSASERDGRAGSSRRNPAILEERRRRRERGYRPVQIWVPDVRSEAFAAEAHRQAARLAAADRVGDDQDFVEAISTTARSP